MGKDWWPMLKAKNQEQIQWCPDGEVRAKRKDGEWKYGKTTNAKYALLTGYCLLKEVEK